MNIFNYKVVYITTLCTSTFLLSLFFLNKTNENIHINKNKITSGINISSTSNTSNQIPLNLNKNNTSIIKDSIFETQNKNIIEYLINIFCTEKTKTYVKAISGSGVFISNPDDNINTVITNAHVARHLLDSSKTCVGRTGNPTKTTHTLTLRYIPDQWIINNDKYIVGDQNKESTGEFDFAILESKRIKPLDIKNKNIYDTFKQKLKIKISGYNDPYIDNLYIHSYPAEKILSKNIYTPLLQVKDNVKITKIYNSPTDNIEDSLLDVTGSKNIDHGSSGGMLISQGLNYSLLGLSSVLIQKNEPQIVRIVTLKHILKILENELLYINNNNSNIFSNLITDMLKNKEVDITSMQIFKNNKLTSILENDTKQTLKTLNIIRTK